MIVVCNSCSARFRIADDKIGPRGAKVRCSRCRSVFVVRRDAAPAGPAPVPPPLPTGGVELALDEGAGPSRRAGAGKGAFADPLAALEVPRPDDPFARAASASASPPPLPGAGDPFAAPAPQAPGGSPHPGEYVATEPARADAAQPRGASFPVTDLSDLSDLAAPPPPAPPPAGDAAGAAPAPGLEEPELATGSQGLALEERTPGSAAGLELGAAAESLDGRDRDELVASGLGVDLAYRAEVLEYAAPPAAAEPPRVAPAEPRRAASAVPRGAALPAAEPPRRPEPAAGRRATRLHSLAVNSLSLAVMLVVAVALFALGQGEAQGDRRLPPWRLFARGTAAPGAPVVASDLSNGIYETSKGARLLFVRGRVVSRSAARLGPVRIQAELLEGQKVVGRAEGLGGAVPTPEELQDVASRADEERLRTQLAPRAARELAPGESIPFLLTFVEYPARLGDLTFRVVAEAAPVPQG